MLLKITLIAILALVYGKVLDKGEETKEDYDDDWMDTDETIDKFNKQPHVLIHVTPDEAEIGSGVGVTEDEGDKKSLMERERRELVEYTESWENAEIVKRGDENTGEIAAEAGVKYLLIDNMEVGDYFEVRGTYASGTSRFSVNLRAANGNYLLHLDFRPTSTIVMNSKAPSWGSEVRADWPGLADGKDFKVTVICDDNEYRIYVNDEPITETFPYRADISEASYIWLSGGSGDYSWNTIKMPGEISDIYTGRKVQKADVASLSASIADTIQGKTVDEIKTYAKSNKGSLALLQWELLNGILEQAEIPLDRTDETISWILSDREALETFMTSGDILNEQYKKGIEIFAEIIRQDPGAKTGLKMRLAVAVGLTFAYDVHSLAVWSNLIDGIARYHQFVKWAEDKVLYEPFYSLTAWHLRYVVGSWATDVEMEWAHTYALEGYRTPSEIGRLTGMVSYNLHNAAGTSVHRGSEYYYYMPSTLGAINTIGGVCGAISKFAVAMAQAHGIPALPVGQPGHCAYIWYREGVWTTGYDISGWDGSSTHSGIQYTWKQPAPFILVMDDAQKNLEGYRLSEKMRIASIFADPGDMFAILQEASNACVHNYAIWVDMEDALNEPTLDKATVQSAMLETLQTYREDKAEVHDIGKDKDISCSCSEDTCGRIVSYSSQWACKDETAMFEIDLGGPCTVTEINIQWWGWSKASKYDIWALDTANNYHLVRSQEDETVDGWFNHYSSLPGWSIKTTKIKVELRSGRLDPWGGNNYFGLRSFKVDGLQLDTNVDLSFGKPVIANEDSSGVDGLLDNNKDTTWSGNSAESWFEIDLKNLCVLNGINFDWTNTTSSEELDVIYNVGDGEDTVVKAGEYADHIALNSGVATKVRVKLEDGEQSLEGVNVQGLSYTVKQLFKMKAKSAFGNHPGSSYVINDVFDLIDQYEYED